MNLDPKSPRNGMSMERVEAKRLTRETDCVLDLMRCFIHCL
jgi:hypothetical protein